MEDFNDILSSTWRYFTEKLLIWFSETFSNKKGTFYLQKDYNLYERLFIFSIESVEYWKNEW